MIHRITYADGSYNEWYEPDRRSAGPSPFFEPDFYKRVATTAVLAAQRTLYNGSAPRHFVELSSKPA